MALTDCNVHIPRCLGTPGMDDEKISAFYDDPVKMACETISADKAFKLRSYSIDPALKWAALRWAKFFAIYARGMLRQLMPTPARSNSLDGAQSETPAWARSNPAHK